MRTILTITILSLAAAGCSAFDASALFGGGRQAPLKEMVASQTPPPASPAAPGTSDEGAIPVNIPPADALKYIESAKPVVIDVRTPDEYAAGHLPQAAMLIDFKAADFREKVSALDRGAKYLIYCRSGHRNGLALGIMKELGFADARDIAGGISAWAAAGLPVVK